MKIPKIKIPKMILNDDLEIEVSITYRDTTIKGKQEDIISKQKFNCIYIGSNDIVYTNDKIETISNGIFKINGRVIADEYDYSGGTIVFKGIKHNILTIQQYRNAFDPSIIDYTEITIE